MDGRGNMTARLSEWKCKTTRLSECMCKAGNGMGTHGTKGEVFVVCTMDEFLKWKCGMN